MWGNRHGKVRGLGAFLDENSEFEGKYSCAGTVLLDAKFSGEIMSKDTLIIGERSVVRASVQTGTLIVHGELVGNVTASELVELKGSARVTGDVEAPIVVMERGAVLDGHCRMTKPTSAAASHGVVVPFKG